MQLSGLNVLAGSITGIVLPAGKRVCTIWSVISWVAVIAVQQMAFVNVTSAALLVQIVLPANLKSVTQVSLSDFNFSNPALYFVF